MSGTAHGLQSLSLLTSCNETSKGFGEKDRAWVPYMSFVDEVKLKNVEAIGQFCQSSVQFQGLNYGRNSSNVEFMLQSQTKDFSTAMISL